MNEIQAVSKYPCVYGLEKKKKGHHCYSDDPFWLFIKGSKYIVKLRQLNRAGSVYCPGG
jgi:hypothetical protein